MRIVVLFSLFIFATSAFGMPQVWDCTTEDGTEYALKGLERADSGEGFKSYTLVHLENEATVVLSVGLFGQSEADGFVAFSGLM
ncbi:MAG: hypothetical protein AAF202_13820, partial [Pseudomonadota bacterium]